MTEQLDKPSDQPRDPIPDTVAEQGWELNEPASPSAVDRAAAWFAERTGTPLPAGYRDLLARTDGLDFNGCVLYATRDHRDRGGMFVAGLAESNERIGDPGGTWVGEANGDLFGLLAGRWVVAARGSREVRERHDDCQELLAGVLRAYLDTSPT